MADSVDVEFCRPMFVCMFVQNFKVLDEIRFWTKLRN